jgi:hypothetical protein
MIRESIKDHSSLKAVTQVLPYQSLSSISQLVSAHPPISSFCFATDSILTSISSAISSAIPSPMPAPTPSDLISDSISTSISSAISSAIPSPMPAPTPSDLISDSISTSISSAISSAIPSPSISSTDYFNSISYLTLSNSNSKPTLDQSTSSLYVTQPYINNIPVKGPPTRYIKDNREPETIPENLGIRRFAWEFFKDLNRIVQQTKYRGGTFVGLKTKLCTPNITTLRHCFTIGGQIPDQNRVTKKSHNVREAIFKACDRDETKWSSIVYSNFWAKRVTIKHRMRCSPYFAATETHLLLPIDIAEANYLLPPPDSVLSTINLIARHAITLQKRRDQLSKLKSQVYAARIKAAITFERQHRNTVNDYNFKLGDLVLIWNMAIEKALNRKMRPRCLGPLIILSRNKGGTYIVAELDGSVFDRPIAAFQVIPYFARTKIDLSPLDKLLNISQQRLQELQESMETDPEDEDLGNSVDPLLVTEDSHY